MRFAPTLTYSFLLHSRKLGRSLNLGDYRFGASNGQEMIDEIYGTGNSYTAEFWQYDSRLGRRWNLDPVDQISISNYAVFRNNPLIYIDPNGDSTIFYDSKGNYLYTSYDELDNAITVIDDDGIDGFYRIKNGIESGELESNNKLIQSARDHGISYSVDKLKRFYFANNNDEVEDMIGYIAEHKTFLYYESGMIKPGGENITQGLPSFVSGGKPEDENPVGEAHTHPNAGKPANYPLRYAHKPSDVDYWTNFTNNEYHDVVLTPKYIYFINSSNMSSRFVIPMRNTFKTKIETNPWRE